MAAITTYATLQQGINDFANNPAVEQAVTMLISLFEAKANRELRMRDQLVRADATADDEFIQVPTDFREMYSLKLKDTVGIPPLKHIGVEEAKEMDAGNITGLPRYFTIVGGAIQILPAPSIDTDLEMIYYATIPALSDANTTNWLLIKAPDIYLYGSLLEAEQYLKNDDRIDVWRGQYQRIMDQMNLEGERSMFQRTQMTAKRRAF